MTKISHFNYTMTVRRLKAAPLNFSENPLKDFLKM